MENQYLTPVARKLRRQMTPEEQKLWYHLRSSRFENIKFRRQFPIDKYIVDFASLAKRLVIEIYGGQHNQDEDDKIRDEYLRKQGFAVLRFWNNDVNKDLESVLEKIYQQIYS